MAPDPGLEVTTVQVDAYRYSTYDTPFWARDNTQPGRWHRRGDGPTQYLALSADGSWAELIRNEELETENEVALVSVPMWAVKVDQALVVDFSTFAKAEEAGFDPEALVSDDYGTCQVEGARLREHGYNGVLAPSAALPGALNLTLFGARMASLWDKAPLLASSIPAVVIAKGAPPPGLLASVRHRGAPHAELVAYISGRPDQRQPTKVRRAARPSEGAS